MKKKSFTRGSSTLCKDANFPLHQSHAEYQLPRFPQAFGPHPRPSSFPQPHTSTHVKYFRPEEDDISMPKISLLCPTESCSVQIILFWRSCPDCGALYVLSWMSSYCNLWQLYPGFHILAVLSIMIVLCTFFVLAVLP